MSFEARIIADSVSPAGARITTFQLRYPAMVHQELMTHRAFSRNASSTRAIPLAKQIEAVETDPAMPVYWGGNQKGMQAGQELKYIDRLNAKIIWIAARDDCIAAAMAMDGYGLHKQIGGRILQPWSHYNVVLTSCWPGLANFFALRCHKDAQPEMRRLAVLMAVAYRDRKPTALGPGEWHLPYVGGIHRADQDYSPLFQTLLKISVARCARVSYSVFGETKPSNALADADLHDRLLANGHWSPFEHQARVPTAAELSAVRGEFRSGNLVGFVQYRQTLPTSVHNTFDFSILDSPEFRADIESPGAEARTP